MTFANFATLLISLVDTVVVPLIFALAFLAFLWGVLQYFFIGGADEGKREEGKQFILYGLIGLVVLFSVWGLLNVLLTTFGL